MSAVALATDQIESEWQFDTRDTRRLRRWIAAQPFGPRLWIGAESRVALRDTYCDTDDWRFYRAGYALRIRQCAGDREVTLKALAGGEGSLKRRRELTERFDAAAPETLVKTPGSVGARIRAVVGRQQILALAEVRTQRRIFGLRLDGSPVGELALDQTAIPSKNGKVRHIRRVEVEGDAAALKELEPFVTGLREAGGLEAAQHSKFETALAARGLEPAPALDLGPTTVDETMTIGEVALATLRSHAVDFLTNEPGARLGEDPDTLHDMRVATRRLRDGLKLFADVLPARARRVRAELRWAARALGAVRDLDVQLARLQTWKSEADRADRSGLETLAGLLRQRRSEARREMLRALDSRRFERLVAALAALVRGAATRRRAARLPIVVAAPPLITRVYKKTKKIGDRLDKDSEAADYHALRIRSKRLRYALMSHVGVYGKPVRRLLRALVALLDILGKHQDAVVAVTRLRELRVKSAPALSTNAAFIVGALATRAEQQATELRDRFPEGYVKIRGKRWRALKHAMEAARPSDIPE